MDEAHKPNRAGLTMPAEWAPQRAVWTAWPAAADLWDEDLADAQSEFLALARALGEGRSEAMKSPRLEILYPRDDVAAEARLEQELGHLDLRCHGAAYGDIWLRDTGPTFLLDGGGALASVRFQFNGWGQRYEFPADLEVGAAVEEWAGVSAGNRFRSALCCEGGAIESDGEGTLMSTTSVLLNGNRGNGTDRARVEAELCRATGARKVLWSSAALCADHTDGHIDTLARFARPGVVLHPVADTENDPNRETLAVMERELRGERDAQGRQLDLVAMPSVGLVEHPSAGLVAASYMNFVVTNGVVVVPAYGAVNDDRACRAIEMAFPGYEIRQCRSLALITGGGSFHCITQQEPEARVEPAIAF